MYISFEDFSEFLNLIVTIHGLLLQDLFNPQVISTLFNICIITGLIQYNFISSLVLVEL